MVVEVTAAKIKVRNKNFFIKKSLIVEVESYFVCRLLQLKSSMGGI
jgi:hypothetical protein